MRRAARGLVVLAGLAVAPARAVAQDVAVLGAGTDPAANGAVREMLSCTGEFASIGVIDVSVHTPTLVELQQYHAVLVWGQEPFLDGATLGDDRDAEE